MSINASDRRLLAALLSGHAVTSDAGEHWVTMGRGEGGAHVLLDKDGRVKAGLGGKYRNVKVDNIPRKNFINEEAYQRKTAGQRGMDYSLPAKVDSKLIIQNRDRSGGASQSQIMSIAANPDYDRLSESKTLADGAPVVAYGRIPKERMGKVITVTDANGNKLRVQYAVMEASDVAASHNEHGTANPAFYSDDPSITRAIAGNGRIAGLQRAYDQGSGEDYRNALIDDADHGVDVGEISGMHQPVLVRVMQPKDVTADIGDRSNTASNLTMTATEAAKQDATRISLHDIDTYSDGSPTNKEVRDFVARLPVSERGSLIDKDGIPTRQAQERMKAAMFAAAYNNDHLTRLASQASNPEQKRIIDGLQRSAGNVAKITESNPEIRDMISSAAERVIETARNDKLTAAETSGDMFKSSDEDLAELALVRIFTRSKSVPEIQSKLDTVAAALKAEADKPDFDLFGEVEKRPAHEVILTSLANWGEPA